MMIIPIQTSPEIVLELHFSKDEKEHPLFTTISSDINQSKSVTVSNTKTKTLETLKEEEDKPETIEYYTKTIKTPLKPEEDITTQLGALVDEIREKYCGDVVSPEIQYIDTKTKEPIYEENDYTGIPRFTIGKITPVKEVTKTIEPTKRT